ncbi:MAG: cation:proton antiporter [Lachnospiraceae bacterium]|jgi:Kef-type K+ transport system membrane component KefB
MDTLQILRDLCIILIFAKFFALLARKIHAPEVAGEIVAGLLIGPSVLGLVKQSDFISGMAEIGVILLMFSAGLETNVDQLKKSGVKATLIAACGVLVPMFLGAILYSCFYGFGAWGSDRFLHAVFIGTILAATSVSITVQVLRELGKIQTEVGVTITSAAVIDDVFGILVLTAVLSMKDPTANIGLVALKTVLFFVIGIIVGIFILKLMKILDARYPHTRRMPIIGMCLAFAYSYVADKYFGVADITGAYIAGIVLSELNDSGYIERKMDINSYMIFGPIFFASIGLQTNLRTLDPRILVFSVCFVIVGMAAKIIGCGSCAKALGYSRGDSLKIGVGMMTRGEVALIVAQRGLKAGMMESSFFTCVILLIIVSSITTPIILKRLYEKDSQTPPAQKKAAAAAKA